MPHGERLPPASRLRAGEYVSISWMVIEAAPAQHTDPVRAQRGGGVAQFRGDALEACAIASTSLENSSSNCGLRCSANPPTFSTVPFPFDSARTHTFRRDV